MISLICGIITIVCSCITIFCLISMNNDTLYDLFDFTEGKPGRRFTIMPSYLCSILSHYTTKDRVLHNATKKQCKKYAKEHGRKIR